ncbi:penicillin acylase [Mangrovactinospora gilvigrisea]|uniref:Penicillin acylase n=1 Tax=Mangrovactinospora gilvigrisea TaxID=1428644 RepID=A0A1J7BBC6_9ACTN|nr:penicillin acylase family protein [Mangrovactinospora gilvigrisea]OIV35926.1 penicillin acylase [Mangrovactinospora gilvigrisea]
MAGATRKLRRGLTAAVTALVLAAAGAPAATATGPAAADTAADQCGGQCGDILPPGENGNATLADILANRALGTHPAHTDDQLPTYAELADDYRSLTDSTINRYFNDSSFGVPAGQVESSTTMQAGGGSVTIVRDKAAGIPHITGTTRAATEYGAGWAAANDRLWLMDLFRHVGRGELSSFAGGAAANRQLEQSFWAAAPYTEADLTQQVRSIASSGPAGQQAMADIDAYLGGVNAYAAKAHSDRDFPGEYDLTGHIDPITNAGGIAPFTPEDLVAIAGVIGALFGSGGGGEVQSALVKEAADARYGTAKGDRVWAAFREENDPEADLTVHDGTSFPYAASPAHPTGVAMPDPGSVTAQQEVFDPTGSAAAGARQLAPAGASAKAPAKLAPLKGVFDKGVLPGDMLTAKHGMSNALVVNGKYTDDGHPIAVFGPQTGYYAPQLLMLEELQGPGLHARGASFAGLSMYVLLGRGPNYAWSATSAGQDVTDTFAVKLCAPDGSATGTPSKDSLYYRQNGDSGPCTKMETLERDDSWKPTLADQTAAGSYKLIVYRTRFGLVQYRATVGGAPVAYTSQRSSYRHEADSIIGFQAFDDPARMATPADFQQSAAEVNFTFNWFYASDRHTAYFNSGGNPVRASGMDPNLPADAAQEWQGWNPDTGASAQEPAATHPHSADQDYYVSWNNKQALGTTAAGFGDGSVHRSNLLDSRVKALVDRVRGGGAAITRAQMVQAMEDAAVTDLRGEDVLPKMLAVIGDPSKVTDPQQAAAVQELTAWQRDGARRVETSAGSRTYADADAIRVMDAWWPLAVEAEFKPGLGDGLYTALTGALQINESPSGGQNGGTGSSDVNESQPHKGSSFQYGWWSYLDKDLRTVLGRPVAGGLGDGYCGGGSPSACRTVLLTTLGQAAAESASQVYPGDSSCKAGDQWCADSIVQRPMGGVTDGTIGWQNRPTYQQAVQFTG